MGYDLHLDRSGAPIGLDEWVDVVAATPNVRIESSGTVLQNPNTGEEIFIAGNQGDASVLVPGEGGGEWVKVFFFSRGGVSFSSRWDIDDASHPIRRAACALAAALGARIVGDEGERYDW
ncbi:hypothetical protein [Rhodospirillum sp. A1_3_36]|uniref:hypothetical protein n=1 Tax=Rhodospirillum sp. A1_3_36 TaxID=3391666 RepID=UPI0039A71F39